MFAVVCGLGWASLPRQYQQSPTRNGDGYKRTTVTNITIQIAITIQIVITMIFWKDSNRNHTNNKNDRNQ